MLKELYDAIVADGRNFDTLEFNNTPSNHIYITEGYGVDVFVRITDDNKFSMQFSAESIHEDVDDRREEEVIKSTVQEVINELNSTCWDESDWG